MYNQKVKEEVKKCLLRDLEAIEVGEPDPKNTEEMFEEYKIMGGKDVTHSDEYQVSIQNLVF